MQDKPKKLLLHDKCKNISDCNERQNIETDNSQMFTQSQEDDLTEGKGHRKQ